MILEWLPSYQTAATQPRQYAWKSTGKGLFWTSIAHRCVTLDTQFQGQTKDEYSQAVYYEKVTPAIVVATEPIHNQRRPIEIRRSLHHRQPEIIRLSYVCNHLSRRLFFAQGSGYYGRRNRMLHQNSAKWSQPCCLKPSNSCSALPRPWFA